MPDKLLVYSKIRLVHSSVYATLAEYHPARVFFPGLQIFHCTGWHDTLLPHLGSFIGTNLAHFFFDQNDFFAPGKLLRQSALVSLFSSLSRYSPKICSLSITLRAPVSPEIEQSFIDFLSSLDGLTAFFNMLPISDQGTMEVITRLANMSTLKEIFTVHFSPETVHTYTNANHQFPSLESFGFYAVNLETIGTVLSSMQCQFRELELANFPFQETAQIVDCAKSLSQLANHPCQHTLTSLNLKLQNLFDSSQDSPTVAQVLQPLFTLSNLQTLNIKAEFLIDLNDEWLANAAIAWPALRHLSLTSHSSSEPKLTLSGFLPLFLECPHLRYLSLRVNAMLTPQLDFNSPSNHLITIMNLAGSPIGYPREIATALRKMCPNLKHLVYLCNQTNGAEGFMSDENVTAWHQVHEILRGKVIEEATMEP